MITWPLAPALALLLAVSAFAQPAAETKSGVQGQVVNLVTGEPVRKAEVKLTPVPGRATAISALTDAQGKFLIETGQPGNYTLTASHEGFLLSRYGSRNWLQPGSTLKLLPGATLKEIEIRIAPQGVIAGKVMDEEGEPIQNAFVQAFSEGFSRGSKILMPAGNASTNDRGEYRIANLNPGRYVVEASPPNNAAAEPAPQQALTAVCFPAALDRPQAERIRVIAGAAIEGIDIALQLVPVVRVKGRLINGVDGSPMRNAMLALAPQDSIAPRSVIVTGDRGQFEFPAVASGSHVLLFVGTEQQITVLQSLEVGSLNIDSLEATVPPPTPVFGSIVVEGEKKLALKGIEVVLLPADGLNLYGTFSTMAAADGTFQLKNLSPVKHKILVGMLPAGSSVKSILVAGKQVLGKQIDWSSGVSGDIQITIAADAATVTGLVSNEKGPASGAVVVLVPADESLRHDIFDRIVPVDQFGAFTIQGVPPMEYKIYAFEELEMGDWQDPAPLSEVESYGQKVVATANGTVTVQLKSIPPRQK